MPMQAMPAPMYFAAVGSMRKLLFEVAATGRQWPGCIASLR
jgi:hypothetical protein